MAPPVPVSLVGDLCRTPQRRRHHRCSCTRVVVDTAAFLRDAGAAG
jgi:hypothetical protein